MSGAQKAQHEASQGRGVQSLWAWEGLYAFYPGWLSIVPTCPQSLCHNLSTCSSPRSWLDVRCLVWAYGHKQEGLPSRPSASAASGHKPNRAWCPLQGPNLPLVPGWCHKAYSRCIISDAGAASVPLTRHRNASWVSVRAQRPGHTTHSLQHPKEGTRETNGGSGPARQPAAPPACSGPCPGSCEASCSLASCPPRRPSRKSVT